jgi:ribonuclease-3
LRPEAVLEMKHKALSERLGFAFKDAGLLEQALTHRSFGTPNNERLEFLGDSVLNFVIANQLYARFPRLSEGDLSRLRAHLVKKDTLFELAGEIGLGDAIRLGEGELKSGGFRRPSILADTLEALFGAAFLDSGFDAAKRLVETLYQPLLDGLDPKQMGKDPKTLLQEFLQSRQVALPVYSVLATEGEAHDQVFTVECAVPQLQIKTQGEGHSRRSAEQEAARKAYEALRPS